MTGTIRIFLSDSIIFPTGFITAVFLARTLGPEGYGIFALVSRLIIWFEWTCFRGFSGTAVKFIGEAPDWRPVGSASIQLQLVMGFLFAGLIWIFAAPVSTLLHEPDLAGYLRLFSIELPILGVASACSNILIGTMRYKDAAKVSAIKLTIRLVLIILFVQMGLSIRGAILGSIAASVVELIISWFYARPALVFREIFHIRRLLGFGAPLFMTELFQRVFRMELFVLKALGATAAQAGYYGAAMNLTITPMIFSRALSFPMLSTLSGLLSKGDDSGAKKIASSSLRSSLWLLPFAAMVAGASGEIVTLIFGKDYLPAGPVLSALIFAVTGMLLINICKTILTALGKPGWTFIIVGPMIPVALVGHMIMIPLMGGIGAAIVTAVVSWLGVIISLSAMRRIWGISIHLKSYIGILCISVFSFGAAHIWPASGIVLVLKILVIAVLILLSLILTGELKQFNLRNLFQGKYFRTGYIE